MRTFISFLLILLFLSCSGSGLEGFVNEPITITALDPDEGQDYDYFWSVENQPDGSLINSRDLKTSNSGKEMVFIPDYPGDYSVQRCLRWRRVPLRSAKGCRSNRRL